MQSVQPTPQLSTSALLCRACCGLLVLSMLSLSACSPSRVNLEQPSIPTSSTDLAALSSIIVPVSEPVPPVLEPPTQQHCASQITLDKRVGQLMFPLLFQSEFGLAVELASLGMLGGVVVLGSPDNSIRDDIALFQKHGLFGPGIVAVDEEGGRVQRLSELTSKVPSARKVAATLEIEQARQLAAEHASAIGQLGFTMNLAPVADLDFNRAIGDRSFGRDANLVSDFAMATAEGILDVGLVPVLKHFPGHGRGSDSHTGLPIIPAVKVLRDQDLVPFIAAAERKDIPIMVGHLVVEGLTQGQPASLSAAAVDGLLRRELGFDGLVITDAFNMDAITATLSNTKAAELSLAAGVDMVMLGSLADTVSTVAHVVESVKAGRISEESITESFLRVMHTRAIDVCALRQAQSSI